MKKKLIVFIILTAISFIVSIIIMTSLYSIIKSKTALNATVFLNSIKNKKVWLYAMIMFSAFFSFIIFYFIKSIKSDSFNKLERSKSAVYGNADWMSKKQEKEKYGDGKNYWCSKDLSNYIGGYVFNSFKKSKDLYFSSINKQNGLVIGTSGTGKSQFFLNPTIQLLARSKNKPSIIVNDLKGELNQANSKILAKNGYEVVVLDLREPRKGTRYNPLGFIYDLYQTWLKSDKKDMDTFDMLYAYIKDIAKVLIPTPEGSDASWTEGAQDICVAVIFAMLEDSENKSFSMCKEKFTIKQLSNILNVQRANLIPFLQNRPSTSRVFHHAGFILDNDSEKTVASYVSTVQNGISKFSDSGIQYITSDTDFDLDKINEKPTAIFLVIPDENKARYRLANLYITQLYNYLTYMASKKANKSLDRTTYFLLDEFGNMPKMPFINEWVSLCRGRNIFFLIILQSISQLEYLYTPQVSKTILQNLHFQCFLGANEVSSLEYFQKLLGTYTIYGKTKSLDSRLAEKGESSGSLSHQKKNLVEIDELQYIKQGQAYVVVNREKPLRTHLVPFYDKKMQSENIFIPGGVNYQLQEKYIDEEATYYDIAKREKKEQEAPDLTGQVPDEFNTENPDDTDEEIEHDVIDEENKQTRIINLAAEGFMKVYKNKYRKNKYYKNNYKNNTFRTK